MLVLTRKIGESLVIDGDITIKVSQIQGNRVKLCIDAPRSHRVVRAEIQTEEAPAPVISRPATRTESVAQLVPVNAK
jgi:carbon storage regulator